MHRFRQFHSIVQHNSAKMPLLSALVAATATTTLATTVETQTNTPNCRNTVSNAQTNPDAKVQASERITNYSCTQTQTIFTNCIPQYPRSTRPTYGCLPSSTRDTSGWCLTYHRDSVAYFTAQQNWLFVLIFLLLCPVTPTHCRSTKAAAASAALATAPIAAPLLGNVATSAALLNSTLATRQKLSLETNSIQRHASTLERDHNRALKRVFLSNRTITCNDGSQAGFYLRKNPNSKKWIVFLEGGWHCYDTRSCRARWLRLRHLMTSAQWPETRDVGGILSPLADENPYWHNANHVLVPYCSSDSWSGTRATAESRDSNWRFMGALILRQVIADLIPLGLGRVAGAELLLVGSSAGGLGVMLNLDRITNFLLHERNLLVTVRGVSDSGWFLDREPYTPSAVASSDAVRQGWSLWQGLLPEECTKQHLTEPWRCYFGFRLYPTLKSPLFIFQWLFDEAQMRADNVGAPVTPQQWNYIHEMGGALRSSLDNVTAVFAPSCIGHAVLSKRDWVNIRIDDISLPAALRCWEHSTRPRRKRHDKLKRSTEATLLLATREQQHKQQQRSHQRSPHAPKREQRHHKHRKSNNLEPRKQPNQQPRLTKEERAQRKRLRHERQQQRRQRRQRNRQERRRNEAERENNLPPGERDHARTKQRSGEHKRNGNGNGRKQRLGHKQRRKHQQQQRAHENDSEHANDAPFQQEQPLALAATATEQQKQRAAHNNANRRHRVPRVPEKCALRLLERCSWPQCNHSCPTLTNPLTGEEMRFLELLTSFGLDIEAVAAALGVDMHTLNNMDRTELVNLLTQQVS